MTLENQLKPQKYGKENVIDIKDGGLKRMLTLGNIIISST